MIATKWQISPNNLKMFMLMSDPYKSTPSRTRWVRKDGKMERRRDRKNNPKWNVNKARRRVQIYKNFASSIFVMGHWPKCPMAGIAFHWQGRHFEFRGAQLLPSVLLILNRGSRAQLAHTTSGFCDFSRFVESWFLSWKFQLLRDAPEFNKRAFLRWIFSIFNCFWSVLNSQVRCNAEDVRQVFDGKQDVSHPAQLTSLARRLRPDRSTHVKLRTLVDFLLCGVSFFAASKLRTLSCCSIVAVVTWHQVVSWGRKPPTAPLCL